MIAMTKGNDLPDPWSAPTWTEAEPPTPEVPRGWRLALSRVTTMLLVAALLFMTFVAYGSAVDNRWYKVIAIQGGSMRPTLEVGDAVVITRPPERVRTGMVLVMQIDDTLVTHRVVEVHDDGTFATQGDANRERDDYSQHDVRVVGVQRARLPGVGRVLTWGR